MKLKFTRNDLNKTLRVTQELAEKTRKRYEIDATGVTLGKLAVLIARQLTGKTKAHYNDFFDVGDFVVVHNIDKIVVTGNKLLQKTYYTYSGRKGNVKSIKLNDLLKNNPERVIMAAVQGMLPRNKLRPARLKRMKLFVGTSTTYSHLHPTPLTINGN